MTTDFASTFDSGDLRKLVGYDMSKAAADQVYEAAGVGPEDVEPRDPGTGCWLGVAIVTECLMRVVAQDSSPLLSEQRALT